jgi:hypothetical protein
MMKYLAASKGWSGAEQAPGEFLRQQPVAVAAGTVQNEQARRSARRLSYTECGVRAGPRRYEI